MFTLRCTQKLLRRLKRPAKRETGSPTTILGDWYVNLLYTRPHQLVLCVNERSLLSVILMARDLDSLIPRFQRGVFELLMAIGIPSHAVQAEGREMKEVAFGKTASRSVLGSMKEITFALRLELDRSPLSSPLELSLFLSTVLMGGIGMRCPREVARELLRGGFRE